jgi:hypothetical protein
MILLAYLWIRNDGRPYLPICFQLIYKSIVMITCTRLNSMALDFCWSLYISTSTSVIHSLIGFHQKIVIQVLLLSIKGADILFQSRKMNLQTISSNISESCSFYTKAPPINNPCIPNRLFWYLNWENDSFYMPIKIGMIFLENFGFAI